jgi:hypothetical protein
LTDGEQFLVAVARLNAEANAILAHCGGQPGGELNLFTLAPVGEMVRLMRAIRDADDAFLIACLPLYDALSAQPTRREILTRLGTLQLIERGLRTLHEIDRLGNLLQRSDAAWSRAKYEQTAAVCLDHPALSPIVAFAPHLDVHDERRAGALLPRMRDGGDRGSESQYPCPISHPRTAPDQHGPSKVTTI